MERFDRAPATLSAHAPDGRFAPVIRAGAVLPASARLVFATMRPGQRTLRFSLHEGEDGPDDAPLVAHVEAALPPGLPANCWLQVQVSVDASLGVAVRVRENLRRIDEPAQLEASEATARHYRVG